MSRFWSLITNTICCSFLFVSLQSFADTVEVKFQLEGEEKIFYGQVVGNHYQFNPESDKILNLATLEWPPYIGENLCNKGWVFQYAVANLVNKGYQVNVHFFPWARSVKMVETGQMDILFPEYFIEDSAPSDVITNKKRKELLALSNQFPGGNISFMKRKGYEIEFNGNLLALKGEKIGVVRGYQNTPEFDAMMDAGHFQIISAVDELQLAKLLVAKRVNLIIGDPSVFRYSINYSKLSLQNKLALLDGIEELKPSLKYNHLYFAISTQKPHWRTLIDDINLSLLTFKLSGATDRIINKGSGCVADFIDP